MQDDIDTLIELDEALDEEYPEYTCWVCDALATPIIHNGEIVGSNCPACSQAER